MTILDSIQRILDSERFGSVVTMIDGPATGQKVVLNEEGDVVAGGLPETAAEDIISDALALQAHEQHRALDYGEHSAFIETLAPPPDLLIFGAVHIAQSLALFSSQMGYRVTVVDARAAFATEDRFPQAKRVLVGWPADILPELSFDRRTWIVILAHDRRHEEPVLEAALRSDVRYIGAMGSRRTHEIRIDRLRQAGFSDDEIARVRGPIGLDIGAETPQEVAISILAEMTMIRYGHGSGVALQGRPGRVHLQRADT